MLMIQSFSAEIIIIANFLVLTKSTREATNAVLCVKVQPHDVDLDKADSDVTFVETSMVVAMSGSITPEPEY